MNDWLRAKADRWATLRSGDWWYYASAFFARCMYLPLINATYGNIDAGGVTMRVAAIFDPGGVGQDLGEITFVGRDDSTRIYVTFADAEQAPQFWDNAVAFLKEMSAHTFYFRQEARKLTADEVIETYYRRRAAGTRVTIPQLAAEYGFNTSYLRAVKVKYDRAGRWGSKKI